MNMKKNKKITGLGEILWDLLPDGKQLGGAPANFVYHAQQLGYDGQIVSAIGHDDLGDEIIQRLQNKNMDCRYITKSEKYPTGKVEVELDGEGNPEYNIIENVAWDHIPYSDQLEKLARQSDAVCFGSLAQREPQSRETIQKFIRHTSHNCIKIFDINLRQNYYNRQIIKTNIELTSVLKLNTDELNELSSMFSINGTENNILEELLEKFDLQLIALTKGSSGSKLKSQDEISYLEPLTTDIKDTVGAGDSFTAALASGLLQGLSLRNCHKNANLLASYVCAKDGATPTITDNILERLK